MSIDVSLPRGQRRRMERMLRKTKSRIEALRCRVLLLLNEGAGAGEVARVAGCVRATVYRTVYRFEELGEEGLRDQRTRRAPTKVSPEVVERLLEYLDGVPKDYGWQRSGWTLELLALELERDTGVKLSCGYIHELLMREGCRRGRPRPGLRIPVRGRRKVLENIAKRVASASPEEEVFYGDEADAHLNPKIGTTYLRRGRQPVVLTPGQNEKRYVFGALNARTGRIVYGIAEKKNSDVFIQFLDYLSRTYRRATRIHLVLDNYIIHKSAKVKRYLEGCGGRIVLHFLPPYSPQDNLIERLWKQMHDQVTRNHQHRTIDALVEDIKLFLDNAQPFPGTKVSTLCLAA